MWLYFFTLKENGKRSHRLTCENFVIGDEQRDIEPDSVKQAREVETSSWACKRNWTK